MVAAEVNPTKFGENKTAIDKKNIIWISLLSGSGAGLACTLLCAPLDVAKVRLQIQGSLGVQKYTGSTFKVIQTIYKEEGWRGVFRGVGPAMLTVPLFWGVYWPIYDRSKLYLSEKYPAVSTPIIHLGAAVTAGVVGDVITNPFWVTRTRIQTLIMHPESKVESMSTFRMMRMIYREEGFLSLYKGLAASFLGLSHVAIQFPLCKIYDSSLSHYMMLKRTLIPFLSLDEFLKRLARDRRKGDEAVSRWLYFIAFLFLLSSFSFMIEPRRSLILSELPL